MISKVNFQLYSSVSPRYIQPLFLQLEFGQWYSSSDLKEILRQNGLHVEGSDIVIHNINAWTLLQIGERKNEFVGGRKILFRINKLGKQLQETFSTNQELFFDLMHYFLYSTWLRSNSPTHGRFWIYTSACDYLWNTAPGIVENIDITGLLQVDSQKVFPNHQPKFSTRSVRKVYPWLGLLMPSFLSKQSGGHNLLSMKRNSCTPQLFHVAVDLVYSKKQLKYGTSMAIGDEEIKSICRVCLLDEGVFWEMADRTKMIIRGVDIRRGQFSTSIALEMKPQWIDLPDYTNDIEFDGFEGEEE